MVGRIFGLDCSTLWSNFTNHSSKQNFLGALKSFEKKKSILEVTDGFYIVFQANFYFFGISSLRIFFQDLFCLRALRTKNQ